MKIFKIWGFSCICKFYRSENAMQQVVRLSPSAATALNLHSQRHPELRGHQSGRTTKHGNNRWDPSPKCWWKSNPKILDPQGKYDFGSIQATVELLVTTEVTQSNFRNTVYAVSSWYCLVEVFKPSFHFSFCSCQAPMRRVCISSHDTPRYASNPYAWDCLKWTPK